MAAIEASSFNHHMYEQRGSAPIPIPIMDTKSPERPNSALMRGVKITEYRDNRVNPEPMVPEESEFLLEEYLSPRKLRDLTGLDNLEDVKYLEMKVDTRDTSLGNFGSHVPNLSQLKLSNSIIQCVRDLGSCLENLKVLWMARCGLEDIDGISTMISLKELYLAYNEIYDISPLSMLENVQIIDLEGNNIDDSSQIDFLSMCLKLENLTLEGNPVCITPSPDQASPDYDYRKAVKTAIPHLKTLDDEPLLEVEEEHTDKTSSSVFEDDWKLIDELMQEGAMMGYEDTLEQESLPGRPSTSLITPITGYRPGSALKPYLATGIRPRTGRQTPLGSRPGTNSGTRPGSARPGSARIGSAAMRPGSAGMRPGSAGRPGSTGSSGRPISSEEDSAVKDASDLTQGGVVCGNPSKALRLRNKHNQPSTLKDAPKLRAMLKEKKKKLDDSDDSALEADETMQELLSELEQFKVVHAERQSQIDASKQAQVLTIDHDDVISLSDDAESISSVEDDEEEVPQSLPTSSRPDSGYVRGSYNFEEGGVKSKTQSPQSPFNPRPPLGSSLKRAPINMRRGRMVQDESFDAQDEISPTVTPPSPLSNRLHNSHAKPTFRSQSPKVPAIRPDDDRPLSGPSIPIKSRFRLEPVVDKKVPKVLDRSNPVIRSSVKSPPEMRTGPRAPTGGTPPSPLQGNTKIRKGHLANVQLLPSKPPSKFGK